MGRNRNWKPIEKEFLKTNWGKKSIPKLAKELGRSIDAIKNMAFELKLGRHLHAMEEMTFCQLIKALGQYNNYQQSKLSWSNHGLPIKLKASIKKKVCGYQPSGFLEMGRTAQEPPRFFKIQARGPG